MYGKPSNHQTLRQLSNEHCVQDVEEAQPTAEWTVHPANMKFRTKDEGLNHGHLKGEGNAQYPQFAVTNPTPNTLFMASVCMLVTDEDGHYIHPHAVVDKKTKTEVGARCFCVPPHSTTTVDIKDLAIRRILQKYFRYFIKKLTDENNNLYTAEDIYQVYDFKHSIESQLDLDNLPKEAHKGYKQGGKQGKENKTIRELCKLISLKEVYLKIDIFILPSSPEEKNLLSFPRQDQLEMLRVNYRKLATLAPKPIRELGNGKPADEETPINSVPNHITPNDRSNNAQPNLFRQTGDADQSISLITPEVSQMVAVENSEAPRNPFGGNGIQVFGQSNNYPSANALFSQTSNSMEKQRKDHTSQFMVNPHWNTPINTFDGYAFTPSQTQIPNNPTYFQTYQKTELNRQSIALRDTEFMTQTPAITGYDTDCVHPITSPMTDSLQPDHRQVAHALLNQGNDQLSGQVLFQCNDTSHYQGKAFTFPSLVNNQNTGTANYNQSAQQMPAFLQDQNNQNVNIGSFCNTGNEPVQQSIHLWSSNNQQANLQHQNTVAVDCQQDQHTYCPSSELNSFPRSAFQESPSNGSWIPPCMEITSIGNSEYINEPINELSQQTVQMNEPSKACENSSYCKSFGQRTHKNASITAEHKTVFEALEIPVTNYSKPPTTRQRQRHIRNPYSQALNPIRPRGGCFCSEVKLLILHKSSLNSSVLVSCHQEYSHWVKNASPGRSSTLLSASVNKGKKLNANGG
ncbi:uncharacterized protein [Clytia hemisphaerica]